MIKKLDIPAQVSNVLKAIERAGSKAYIVGQCISELLRGGTPMDYDIITNADFEEMQYIFREMRIVSKNAAMSTVMVSVQGMVVQVSSYKSAVENETAVYTDNYLYDLAGRDFSVNAIAYHPRKGFKDPFDGISCINDGVITLKAIGEYPVKLWKENDLDENELTLKLEPKSCFESSPANIFSALYYLGCENYTTDDITAEAIKKHCGLIKNLTAREIHTMLTKVLLTRNISSVMQKFPEVFAAAAEELSDSITDGCGDGSGCGLWEHISRSVEFSPPFPDMRYAMLFHNSGKPDCMSVDNEGNEHYYGHAERGRINASMFFRRSKADRTLCDSVDFLIENHDTEISEDRVQLKRLLGRFEVDELKKLIKMRIADDMAKPSVHEGRIASYRRALQVLDDILATGECCRYSQLAIKESDLIRNRLASNSRQAQLIIDKLFDMVLEQPKLNFTPVLIEIVRKSLGRVR